MRKMFLAAAIAVAAMLTSCCNNSGTSVQMGSLSKFDTLSYAMGANIARGFSFQMRDLPLDWQVVEDAMMETATIKLDTAKYNKHDEQIKLLNKYFGQVRGTRMREIAKKRAEADSIRLASGDTTKVEYPVADPAMFENEEERTNISYAIGYDLGYNIGNSDMPLHLVWIAEAMKDSRDKNLKVEANALNAFLQRYSNEIVPQQNLEASIAWLEKMAGKSGAQTTESGLVYKITDEGDMNLRATSLNDRVKVHYTGRLRTGKVFDSSIYENLPLESQMQRKRFMPDSYDKNEPVEFELSRVIKGWGEGLQLVGKGGKITLWIPAELAYGARGTRGIGRNEALEFEVEVLDVIPAEQPEEAPAETVVEMAAPVAK